MASTLGAELLSLSKALAGTKWMRSTWAEARFPAYTLETDKQLDSPGADHHGHGQQAGLRPHQWPSPDHQAQTSGGRDDIGEEGGGSRKRASTLAATYEVLADG